MGKNTLNTQINLNLTLDLYHTFPQVLPRGSATFLFKFGLSLYMKKCLLILLYFNILYCYAQSDQNNWYFGNRAAVSFETGTGVAKFDNPQQTQGPSASISDPATGELLFYSNGKNVWNKAHTIMANGGGISSGPVKDVIIFQMPGSKEKYYLMYIENASLMYVIVDMSSNGGGSVVQNPVLLSSGMMGQIAVIRHKYIDAYWIITHDASSNSFFTNYVDKDGIGGFTVVDNIGLSPLGYGDIVASNSGDKLVVTHYAGNDNVVEVFDFNRVCGGITNSVVLPKEGYWDNAYGAAFSPDDSKLYITYSYQLSQLVQYSGTGFQTMNTIAASYNNFNILRLGPDQKIYIATHDDGIPGPRLDAILKPSNLATGCDYRLTYLTVDDGNNRNAYFELPAYAMGKQIKSPVDDGAFAYTNTCLGELTKFSFNTSYPYDSLEWDFGDSVLPHSRLVNPSVVYPKAGKYRIKLTIYKCGFTYPLYDSITIYEVPVFNLFTDTILCSEDILQITAPRSESYRWSTGETTQSISVSKRSKIWLQVANGKCTATHDMNVSYHPEIITALGPEYHLCEDDSELVILNAGEGFRSYKWTPTEDTTQWITVNLVGSYFVKVSDHFGCRGDGKTKVKRRCGVSLFYPNVFTPNNDGINDTYLPVGSDVVDFNLKIYNAWGGLVFESNSILNGWDGKLNGVHSPAGTYVYSSTYTGYRSRKLTNFSTSGNLTLLR
jgi:gliding motility-associated-like protein